MNSNSTRHKTWHVVLDEVHDFKVESREKALEGFRDFLKYLIGLPLTGGTTERPSLDDYVGAWTEEELHNIDPEFNRLLELNKEAKP